MRYLRINALQNHFSEISHFLERILMEHIDMKNSLESKLHTYSICSIRNRSKDEIWSKYRKSFEPLCKKVIPNCSLLNRLALRFNCFKSVSYKSLYFWFFTFVFSSSKVDRHDILHCLISGVRRSSPWEWIFKSSRESSTVKST